MKRKRRRGLNGVKESVLALDFEIGLLGRVALVVFLVFQVDTRRRSGTDPNQHSHYNAEVALT